MKILVIGSGGREHALVWKLAQSPHAAQMWCAPGNAGIAQERLAKNSSPVECVNMSQSSRRFAETARVRDRKRKLNSPSSGRTIRWRSASWICSKKNGLRIWGPNQKAAQFESSKVFSQNVHGEIRHSDRARRNFFRCGRRKKIRRRTQTANAP